MISQSIKEIITQQEHIIYNQTMTTLDDSIPVAKITKQDLLKVDYQLFTVPRQHFVLHALQHKYKLPSQASILRSQIRNNRKSGIDKADQTVGRPDPKRPARGRIARQPRQVRRIPARRAPILRGGRTCRSFGRGFQLPQKVLPMPIKMKTGKGRSLWMLERTYYQAPTQAQPAKARATPKERVKVFKTLSPELIREKCERKAAIKLIEQARKQTPPIIQAQLDLRPEYFRKKKANQKRRRQIKHELIKKNRRALMKIYGAAIFQSCWPVGIKQIKTALGIKQEDHLQKSLEAIQGLGSLVG